MKAPEVIGVDFETDEILDRPAYPPVPVGVSIQWPGERKPKYWAWGHPTGNNCTKAQAQAELSRVWKSGKRIVFHHGKFDIEVATVHMGMKMLPWDRIDDTMFLLFLDDPHARQLSLKPAAERLLGMKPEERDAVRDWLIEHGVVRKNDAKWGRYISKAPGTIVAPYANGDVTRTVRLYKHLLPKINDAGMMEAYNRERRIMPIFMESEREGLRVDLDALERDIPIYENAMLGVERWLCKRLKAKDVNFDADDVVSELLDRNEIVTEWTYTAKSRQRSMNKKYLTFDKFHDPRVFLALGYRNRLNTCLSMFMRPWLEKGSVNNSYIHPNWNQVRQPKDGDDTKGTRTGRPSCDNPNLLNVSKSFYDRGDFYEHPQFIKAIPELPLVRRYALPDKGDVWCHRDYNQQELRILAHFEDGALLAAYRDNPELDVHSFIKSEVKRLVQRDYDRSHIKTTVFGRIYGQGLGGLAEKMNLPVEEVKGIRDSQNKVLPGLKHIEEEIKDLAKSGEPIITWGGRQYYVEVPKFVEKFNRVMTFEYKLLNYLVQGSAADVTKEAIIRHNEVKKDSRFLVTVYDEINISSPKGAVKKEMKLLKDVMEGIEMDVFMKSDGKVGANWGSLSKYKE